MPIIKDQSEILAEIAALTVTATGLATAAHPLPVRDHADDLASLEALESFIAQRQVTMRLHSPQPRQAGAVSHPAPVHTLPSTAPAKGRISALVTGVSNLPVKLTATDKARMAKGLPVTAKPAKLTATEKVLAAQAAILRKN